MAWTAPRTWVTGEVVTAALMNTHVRDNLADLHQIGSLFHMTEYLMSSDLTLTTTEVDIPGLTTGAVATPGSHRYLVVLSVVFITNVAQSGADLIAYLNVGGTNRGPNIRIEDHGDLVQDHTQTMVWSGTRSDTSITYKARAEKDNAGGTHLVQSANSVMCVALWSAT